MRIYMAARYSRRLETRKCAEQLCAAGHEITSRWIDGAHETADGDKSRWGEFAQDDVDDICTSDTFILFTENKPWPRGSRLTELGIALMLSKLRQHMAVVIIGPIENVFCAYPGVIQFNSFDEFTAAIENQG